MQDENLNFTYPKQQFRFSRCVFSYILLIVFCFLALAVLPLSPPLLIYTALVPAFYERMLTIFEAMIFFAVFTAAGMILPLLFFSCQERKRFPITFSFSKNTVMVSCKNKSQRFYLDDCMYTDSLSYVCMCDLFKGCWKKGIALYIPHEKNRIIPLTFVENRGQNPYFPLYIPVETADDKQKLLSHLRSSPCQHINISWTRTLLCALIPSVSLWCHVLLALLFYRYIGFEGICYTFILGLASGTFLMMSFFQDSTTTRQPDSFLFWGQTFFLIALFLFLFVHVIMSFGTEKFGGALFIFLLYGIEMGAFIKILYHRLYPIRKRAVKRRYR